MTPDVFLLIRKICHEAFRGNYVMMTVKREAHAQHVDSKLVSLDNGGAVMPKTTGARLFADMMRGYEVSHIFFVPAFMLKAFAEMEDMPIARIMVHGEKAAAYMADGYARASGKPGVCMAQMIGAS